VTFYDFIVIASGPLGLLIYFLGLVAMFVIFRPKRLTYGDWKKKVETETWKIFYNNPNRCPHTLKWWVDSGANNGAGQLGYWANPCGQTPTGGTAMCRQASEAYRVAKDQARENIPL
jgi:hypothetical protein